MCLSYLKSSLSLPNKQILKAKMAVIQVVNNPLSWHIFRTFTAFAFPSWISFFQNQIDSKKQPKGNTTHKDKKKALRGHGFQEGKKKALDVWKYDEQTGCEAGRASR